MKPEDEEDDLKMDPVAESVMWAMILLVLSLSMFLWMLEVSTGLTHAGRIL